MLALDRLTVLGSALLIGAHPDDENSGVLAYLLRGLKVRSAYLSLTRGEGGQNLLGPEQGELLGLIRTQELLAARRIDGAEQYFTRAIDFGYSKTAEESLSKWGHEAVLGDVVWVIRRFRPDVIVQIFSGTPRDGHGHHQAAGVLAREAFTVAADGSRFPEQFRWVEPWQARRLLQGGFTVSTAGGSESPSVEVNTGELDSELGVSYAEIARMSRRVHRSQGMDTPERRSAATEFLTYLAGEPLTRDVFEGIDTTWNRVPGGVAVGRILEKARRQFLPEQPEETLRLLLEARPLLATVKDPWGALKLRELDAAIALCAGVRLEASSGTHRVTPGGSLQVNLEVLNRSRFPLVLKGITMEGMPSVPRARLSIQVTVPTDQPYSQPYWLRKPRTGNMYTVDEQEMIGLAESPPVLSARFRMEAGAQEIEFVRPVALAIVPPVSMKIAEPVLLFPDERDKTVEVVVCANVAAASGALNLEAPEGWRIRPSSHAFHLADVDDTVTLTFTVTPPAGEVSAELRAVAGISSDRAKLIRTDVLSLARRVGYVMGAGDEVPRALRQMVCEVTLLNAEDLARGDLSRFDAIVTGVRAYNARADLHANRQRLLDYMQAGGTVVVQYNVADGRSPEAVANVGPYPLKFGRGRVTHEEAPVTFLNPRGPLLVRPNEIDQADFEGWVQERGLYFASEWDSRYEALFECHDPGEGPLTGATLYARCGKGAYVFTAFSWFRQLPAGVPGAFRIFANLLSAGKVAP